MTHLQLTQIVENLSVRNVVNSTYAEFSNSSFHDAHCILNMETGEVFFTQLGKNEWFQKPIFISLYKISGCLDLNYDDILGDDDLPEDGDITSLDDYDDRVINALIWYIESDFRINAMNKINEYV